MPIPLISNNKKLNTKIKILFILVLPREKTVTKTISGTIMVIKKFDVNVITKQYHYITNKNISLYSKKN